MVAANVFETFAASEFFDSNWHLKEQELHGTCAFACLLSCPVLCSKKEELSLIYG